MILFSHVVVCKYEVYIEETRCIFLIYEHCMAMVKVRLDRHMRNERLDLLSSPSGTTLLGTEH